MVVRDHPPEPAERCWRGAESERTEITLDEAAEKIVSPGEARLFVGRKKRAGKSAAEPEHPLGGRADVVEGKTLHVHECHPPCQRLRHAPHEVRRRAAEQQEPCRRARPVEKHPQDGEEFWQPLHLVDHHEATEPLDRQQRVAERRLVGWVLEVEHSRSVSVSGCKFSREGRLAALPRPE